MLPCQMSSGQYISNRRKDHGGDEGVRGGDEWVVEIVATEEVVVVLEIVVEEGEIIAEIVEEAEESEILREEVTVEGWRAWWRRRRSW